MASRIQLNQHLPFGNLNNMLKNGMYCYFGAEKWYAASKISKEFKDYISIENARTCKNDTLYKAHKPENPVRLLISGCNTNIELLSRYIESICTPLTEGVPCRIKDTAHLLSIIDDLNKDYMSDNYILVSFDIANMYPSIDNVRGITAVTSFLNMRETKLPLTECVIIKELRICLYHNNSIFTGVNLLQTNGTATGAPNSCSYADIAVPPIYNAALDQKAICFDDLMYFGKYRDHFFFFHSGKDQWKCWNRFIIS